MRLPKKKGAPSTAAAAPPPAAHPRPPLGWPLAYVRQFGLSASEQVCCVPPFRRTLHVSHSNVLLAVLQVLMYGETPLIDDSQTLGSAGILNGETLTLSRPLIVDLRWARTGILSHI